MLAAGLAGMVLLSADTSPSVAAAAPALPKAAEVRCDEVRPAELEFTLRSGALELEIGDIVELQAVIVNTSAGLADIPLFRLAGAEPALSIEEQESSYPEVDFVRYWLRAVRPGRAELQVWVNFATSAGCIDAPRWLFRSVRSLRYPITVRGAATSSATPTPTATPQPVRPTYTVLPGARWPMVPRDCIDRRAAQVWLSAAMDRNLGRAPGGRGSEPVGIERLVAAVRRAATCRAATAVRTSAGLSRP